MEALEVEEQMTEKVTTPYYASPQVHEGLSLGRTTLMIPWTLDEKRTDRSISGKNGMTNFIYIYVLYYIYISYSSVGGCGGCTILQFTGVS